METISETELKIILNLATRFVVMGKSSLLMVPDFNGDDNAHQRAVLLEKAAQVENLEKMRLLTDVTDKEDFAELIREIEVKTKREIKLYVISTLGLAMYQSEDDKWSAEQKEEYTGKLIHQANDDNALKAYRATKSSGKS